MPSTRTEISTKQASSYMLRLCKLWAQMGTADYTPQSARIHFDGWTLEMDATRDGLEITIDATQERTLARHKQMVADQLQRFARQETLEFYWY
jgi:uncharacterized protein